MFASFTSVLPWSTCGNEWNTANCVEFTTATNSTGENVNRTIANSTGVNATLGNATVLPTIMANMSNVSTTPTALAKAAKVSASVEYWE